MNIFYLDKNPRRAAQMHCDKHVVKMILETAQLLSTAWHVLQPGDWNLQNLYKPTHANHPCARWVRERFENYQWTVELGLALCDEYTHRYRRWHKSGNVIEWCILVPPNLCNEEQGGSPPAQAMPDEYKHSDPVVAYRSYYSGAKRDILAYTNRSWPEWLVQLQQNRPHKETQHGQDT